MRFLTSEEKYELNRQNWEYIRDLSKEEQGDRKTKRGLYRCKMCGREKDLNKRNFTKKVTLCPHGCHGGGRGFNYVISGVDDLATTHPHLVKYFVDKEIAYTFKKGSKKKVKLNCPHCDYEKEMTIQKLTSRGFKCNVCNDSFPFPEKYVANLLNDLEIEFVTQYTIKNYRYDFYIPSLNVIIETHGEQHYLPKKSTKWKSLEEEQRNDIDKWMMCQLKLGSDLIYVVLDCRNSEGKWIENSIKTSVLSTLFDLSNIDWKELTIKSSSSWLLQANELYNKGLTTKEIAEKTKLSRSTIINYLCAGAELGLSNYNPKEEMRKNGAANGKNSGKQVIMLREDMVVSIYKSTADCEKEINYPNRTIAKLCRGEGITSKPHFSNSLKLGGLVGFYYLDSEDWERDKHSYADDKGLLKDHTNTE